MNAHERIELALTNERQAFLDGQADARVGSYRFPVRLLQRPYLDGVRSVKGTLPDVVAKWSRDGL